MNQKLFAALPIIVNNYSRLFGVQVRMQGVSAYTNGHIITIPRLDLNDPVISRYAYGYLAHEAAHVRYTSFRTLSRYRADFLIYTLVNILEDARVERLIGREFIGVWENLNLIRADAKSWRRYLDGLDEMDDLQLLLGFLIPYLASYCQQFPIQRPRAALLLKRLRARFSHKALRKLCALALEVLKTRSTAEVCHLACRLQRLLASDEFFGDVPLLTEVPNPGPDDEELQASASFKRRSAELLAQTAGKLDRVAPGCDFASMMEQMVCAGAGSRDDFGSFTTGACRPGRADFASQVKETYALRRLLRLRLYSYIESFSGSSERGRRLNLRRAALVPYGERRIFKPKICTRDYSTSVHILVDVSGSMMACDGCSTSRCEQACISALSLALALQGIDGITTLATFFPGWDAEFEEALNGRQTASARVAYFDQKPRGSTPLAQAVWYALGQAGNLQCSRNIVIIITDGIPDSVEQTRRALGGARRAGIEVYGIGIKSDFVKNLIADSAVIERASDLVTVLFKLLMNIFPLERQALS